jgi:hypothetical protein
MDEQILTNILDYMKVAKNAGTPKSSKLIRPF